MIKRPLCLVFICFMVILRLFDLGGGRRIWQTPQDQQLQKYVNQQCPGTITGQVFRQQDKTNSSYIYLKNVNLTVQSEQFFPKKVIIKIKEVPALSLGNVITAEGFLECIAKASNPGQFDAEQHYGVMEVEFFVVAESIAVVSDQEALIPATLQRINRSFSAKLEQLVPKYAGRLTAMLLGDRSALTEDHKNRFQMSGITHILAISGLHLTLLGMGIYKGLRVMRVNNKIASIFAMTLLSGYTIMTGASVSAVRALLMFMVMMGSKLWGRSYDLLSALSLAGVLILAKNPAYLYYSGFILSFGAVTALGVVLPLVKKTPPARGMKIGTALGAGLIIFFTTLPLVLYFFYEISVYGILVNLLVIPTVGVVIGSAILGGVLGYISVAAGQLVLTPAIALLELYNQMGKMIQGLPYPTLILGQPAMGKIVAYYLIGGCILLWWKGKKNAKVMHYLMLGSGFVVMSLGLSLQLHTGLEITALDVGQGDALVVRNESGAAYLIDGGSSNVGQVGQQRIIPYLKSQGIQRLAAVFVTHPDNDHVNGVVELFETIAQGNTSLRVTRCFLPAWMAGAEDESGIVVAAQQAGVEINYLQQGDVFINGETKVQILHPNRDSYKDDFNAGSLSFVVEYGQFRGLFTGDLCGPGERLVQQQSGGCDFLKIAHHGSNSSTDAEFLQAVKPRLGVISCAKENYYGHPHPDLIRRLERVDCQRFLTMEGGAITVRTDGKGSIWVTEFLK